MNLQLNNKYFIVTGASSGFGLAITEALLAEGANILAVARSKDGLDTLKSRFPSGVTTLAGDITLAATQDKVLEKLGKNVLSGVVVNAGGPPAMSFCESNLADWDAAYQQVLRWKIEFTKKFLPLLEPHKYGRVLYIESVSVLQPIENLVLSNSLRMAVVGFVKTLSQEKAHTGITFNIAAPGYHATAAMLRLFRKRSDLMGLTLEEAKHTYELESPMQKLGDPHDFAKFAVWLLSPYSKFVTGVTYPFDGGLLKSSM